MHAKKGFTLIEILVVMAVLTILTTITIGGARMVQQTARARRFGVTKEVLRTAIARYRAEYNRWPGEDAGSGGEKKKYKDDNYLVIDDLREGGKGNPDRIRFLDETSILTSVDGKVVPLSSASSSGCPAVYVTKDGTKTAYYEVTIDFELDTVTVGPDNMVSGTPDDEY